MSKGWLREEIYSSTSNEKDFSRSSSDFPDNTNLAGKRLYALAIPVAVELRATVMLLLLEGAGAATAVFLYKQYV